MIDNINKQRIVKRAFDNVDPAIILLGRVISMDERNIQEAIFILQNDGYLKNEQIAVGDEKRGFRKECMVNFLMRLYRIKEPYHTREWINSRLRLLKIEDGKCMMCCYCWGRNNTPKSFYRCMEELISAVKQDT